MRALGLLLVLLAGCVGPAAEIASEDGAAPVGPALALLPAIELPTGSPTHEPSIAVDGAGAVLVAAASPFDPAPLWASQDGGATFARVRPIDLPVGTEGQPAFSRDGDAYVVDETIVGLTVARSRDSGVSWEVMSYAALAVPGGDRPWVAAGEGGRVYATWSQMPSGQWVAASTDGGRTFPVQMFVGPWLSTTGPMVVAPDGTLFLARAEAEGPALYASRDGALTFQRTLAWSAVGPNGWLFATPAVDASGNVYVTTVEQTERGTRARWASSADGGATFSEPREATDAPGIHVHAWSAAGPEGRLAIAFYEAPDAAGGRPDDADADWFLRLVVLDGAHTDAPVAEEARVVGHAVHQGSVCTTGTQDCSNICPPLTPECIVGRDPGEEFLGDYLGVAVAPDGSVHVAFQETTDGHRVWYARTGSGVETVMPEGAQPHAWS